MSADRGLRILMTVDTVGGVWPFAMELCAQLARRGDTILLAALGGIANAEQRRQASAIPGLSLHARPYRLVWMRDPWRDLEASARWLQALARDFAPDVVHLNDLAHGDLDWRAPVLTTAHSCVCSWWQAVHGWPAPPSWDRYRACVSASLRASGHVVAPSRAMLRALVRHHGGLPSVEVIHNGRGADRAAAVVKAPFVLGAGRLWDEAKNLGALAAIAPRLPWPVYLAGDTRHPDGGTTTCADVHCLGRLPGADLHEWMARAAIYALPARYEPFGLSALEAAQRGCALVLGDIPSLREIWGDAAIFVAPDDPRALEAALLGLIGDHRLRNTLAERARRRARRYTPEAMADRYRRAFRALAAAAAGASIGASADSHTGRTRMRA